MCHGESQQYMHVLHLRPGRMPLCLALQARTPDAIRLRTCATNMFGALQICVVGTLSGNSSRLRQLLQKEKVGYPWSLVWGREIGNWTGSEVGSGLGDGYREVDGDVEGEEGGEGRGRGRGKKAGTCIVQTHLGCSGAPLTRLEQLVCTQGGNYEMGKSIERRYQMCLIPSTPASHETVSCRGLHAQLIEVCLCMTLCV